MGLALAAAFLAYSHLAKRYAADRFASRWEERLPSYRAVAQPPETAGGAKLVKLALADGSWILLAEHDIHDGGLEWDQTVLYDSRGELRRTAHHFCGWEGLSADLEPYRKAKSLDDFYSKAAPLQLVAGGVTRTAR